MRQSTHVEIVRRLIKAVKSHDPDRFRELVGADARLTNMASGEVYRGPQGYLELAEMWATAFPDLQLEVLSEIAVGDWVVVELTVRGTHKGTFLTPSGPIEATGRRLSVPLCQVMQLQDGVVMNARLYLDALTLADQLGAPPEGGRPRGLTGGFVG